ncbi:MAG: hypothetical protein COV52_02350 [Gammaproteobacteria bacterium CG11_big_fil_rev_8_21_14_0_20_46_22]|nr:MAG: hypothetical protein COW05_08390 [Gammaproteobacteria bacterium CG12_big_fil_rev_8_21_14_0_65_46_12]PIR11621.1 MAG: hypothetical protein COV52_02350 [Gammaproteobacteria bacterium CG11_big_fil_rev_8_21_14_0_20_46_22]
MIQNNEAYKSDGVLGTGDSPESRETLKHAVTYYENLDQKVITITEDKLKLILIGSFKKLEDKKTWITPFGIFIAILLVFLTTENFRNFLSIPAPAWQAACYIALVVFFCWMLWSVVKVFLNWKVSIASVINEIKNDKE